MCETVKNSRAVIFFLQKLIFSVSTVLNKKHQYHIKTIWIRISCSNEDLSVDSHKLFQQVTLQFVYRKSFQRWRVCRNVVTYGGLRPVGKFYYDETCSCPRGWHLSASWGLSNPPPWIRSNITAKWYWRVDAGLWIGSPLCWETWASRMSDRNIAGWVCDRNVYIRR